MRSVLLIEDDIFDTMTAQKSFARFNVPHTLHTAFNGEEALDLLLGRRGQEPLRPLPEIILLDLNMPRMNGLEFLAAIRADEDLKASVVFMITTSKAEEDKARAYEKNVAGYIVKQDPANTFMQAVALLEHYWKIVEFPE